MAANYRAVGLARSKPEFVSKLGVVVDEAVAAKEESPPPVPPESAPKPTTARHWIAGLLAVGVLLLSLVAIFVASRKTAKS